ncbi:hypothetical protein PBRA_009341 [Plasmodiophora brassicae]|uniref:Protein kinase domain-containing protein n=1 Tax=Plasmodiophora brassicae TaxID=37360 RepID=A0A0G4J6C6_PLABS|nr:hypothetical protein PBRA_009341 [Plasmodiophora brassicae]
MAVPRTPRDEDGFVLVKADDGSAPLPDHVAQLADSMQRVDLNGTSPTESDAQTGTADAHPSRPCLPCTTHQRVPVIDRPARLGVEKLTHAPLNLRVFPESPLSLDEFEFVTGDPGSLGTGAMGSVLLARWKTRPGQPWRAIKKVSKFQIWKDDDPVMLFEQLWDEVEALMTLRHPHIVQVDGYVEDYKYIYLIMEYAPKGDLNQALSDKSRFDDRDAARHVRSLVTALLHLHKHGYLHRDVKPENMLLSESGDLLLADFGCVATVHSSRKSLCGTRYYHSYEIAQSEPHDEASDAWSVGVVAYELLHGRGPFESDVESDDEEDGDEEDDDGQEDDDDDEDDEVEDGNGDGEDVDTEQVEATEDNSDDADEDTESEYGAAKEADDERGAQSDSDDRSPAEDAQSDGSDAADNDDTDDDEDRRSDDDDSDNDAESEGQVAAIYERITSLRIVWPEEISECARDFISRLLVKDKGQRMTLEAALDHPWLASLPPS